MKTIKNGSKQTFIINKHFNKSHSNIQNKITKYAKKNTLKAIIKPVKLAIPIKMNTKVSYYELKTLINSEKKFISKLKIFIKDILNLDTISENNIINFLKFINIKTPIKYALQNVPDLLALPMRISSESIPINIYKNYKKQKNIISKISLILLKYLYIKYKINILYNKLIKSSKNDKITTKIKYLFKNIFQVVKKKISYFHLKYLVHLSKKKF